MLVEVCIFVGTHSGRDSATNARASTQTISMGYINFAGTQVLEEWSHAYQTLVMQSARQALPYLLAFVEMLFASVI